MNLLVTSNVRNYQVYFDGHHMAYQWLDPLTHTSSTCIHLRMCYVYDLVHIYNIIILYTQRI